MRRQGPAPRTTSSISKAVDFYIYKPGMKKTFENGSPAGFVILRRDDAEIHLIGNRPRLLSLL